WDALWREQEKLDAAVTLVAGIHVEANADRSVVPVGDEFAIRARIRCRPEVECIGGFPVLAWPDGMKEVKRSPDKGDSQATITIQVEGNPETGPLTFLEPIGHSRMGISTRMNVSGYGFDVREQVIHIAASSTIVSRVPLHIVPAYTVAVEPRQEIEKLAAEHKPFNVFLRVHSYSQKAANVSVGLDVPEGWKT